MIIITTIIIRIMLIIIIIILIIIIIVIFVSAARLIASRFRRWGGGGPAAFLLSCYPKCDPVSTYCSRLFCVAGARSLARPEPLVVCDAGAFLSKFSVRRCLECYLFSFVNAAHRNESVKTGVHNLIVPLDPRPTYPFEACRNPGAVVIDGASFGEVILFCPQKMRHDFYLSADQFL